MHASREGSSIGTVGGLAGRGFCNCTMWRRCAARSVIEAHQLGRSQAGKHDLPAVQTSRDDGLAREVVLGEPHPGDL